MLKLNNNFIQRDKDKLFFKGKKIELQGLCFSNNVWEEEWENFEEIPTNHHTEKDYKLVKSWGINAIRFYMNYKTFENDDSPYTYKETGWQWLDKNISWAKKHNIFLILNMHVPQGGFECRDIWNNKKNQERYLALWKTIALRYKNEPTIAGYDLINNPIVESSHDQWKSLAEKAVAVIRNVDPNHLIVVESVLGISDKPETFGNADNLFLVNDQNVLYSFHFYDPMQYTHQKTVWTPHPDYNGKYPDNEQIIDEPYDVSNEKLFLNKDYLVKRFQQYINFTKKNNVPIYASEFGVVNFCYEDNKGGENWIADMIDIFKENNINFTYHCFHERWFGLFYNEATEPPDANKLRESVVKIFIEKLK